MRHIRTFEKITVLSAFTALMLSVSGCGDTKYISGNSSTPPPVTAKTEATIKKSVDDYFAQANPYFTSATGSPVPGAIVAVKMPGQQPYYYATGCAEIDLTQQKPGSDVMQICKEKMSTDKQFRIASITKTFVAQTILEMAKEGTWKNPNTGKLFTVASLDNDTAEDWLPGALTGINAVNKNYITISQLLNHTSGLYTYITTDAGLGNGLPAKTNFLMNKYVMNQGKSFWNGQIPTTEVLNFVNTYSPPASEKDANGIELFMPYGENPYYAPGNGLHYSNTNYFLLGLIIEKMTDSKGKSYKVEDQIKRLITDKLNLQATTLPVDPSKSAFKSTSYVHGYTDYYNKPITTQKYTDVEYAILKFRANDKFAEAMYSLPSYIPGDGYLEDFSNADMNFLWTTGGMVTNMQDLLAFLQNIIDTRVKTFEEGAYWKSATSDLMGNSFEYSRGLVRIGKNTGASWIGHSGQFAGYSTAAYWLSALDTYVIVMTNKYAFNEDDGTYLTLGLNGLGMSNSLYKKVLYPAAPVTTNTSVGLVNAIIKSLANDPSNASKMVGKSVDSLLLPDVSSQMK